MKNYQKNRLESRKENKYNTILCEACIYYNKGRRRVSSGIHHIYGRYGSHAHDPENIIAVCIQCHEYAHSHNTVYTRQLLHDLAKYIIITIGQSSRRPSYDDFILVHIKITGIGEAVIMLKDTRYDMQ